jgi:hypothetical protein
MGKHPKEFEELAEILSQFEVFGDRICSYPVRNYL